MPRIAGAYPRVAGARKPPIGTAVGPKSRNQHRRPTTGGAVSRSIGRDRADPPMAFGARLCAANAWCRKVGNVRLFFTAAVRRIRVAANATGRTPCVITQEPRDDLRERSRALGGIRRGLLRLILISYGGGAYPRRDRRIVPSGVQRNRCVSEAHGTPESAAGYKTGDPGAVFQQPQPARAAQTTPPPPPQTQPHQE